MILRDDTQLKAKLIGSDSRVDVAVLKVEPPNKKPLPVAKSAIPTRSRVGDWVIAIGNSSHGYSVTAASSSARGRALSDSLDDYLQTDAASKGTRAVRCSTPTARSSASTRRSIALGEPTRASLS